MAQLMSLKISEGEKLQIIESLAADWKRTGLLMDLDPMGRTVANIEAEHAHKRNGPVICCQEIFAVWLDKTDATWENLIKQDSHSIFQSAVSPRCLSSLWSVASAQE